jgi:anti-sigma factor RsiW
MTGGTDLQAFHADLDALASLVTRLRAFEQRATEREAELEREAGQLAAHWSGSAAVDHAAAHRRWLTAHQRIRAAAARLAHLVDVAHANYSTAAATNTRMWA